MRIEIFVSFTTFTSLRDELPKTMSQRNSTMKMAKQHHITNKTNEQQPCTCISGTRIHSLKNQILVQLI